MQFTKNTAAEYLSRKYILAAASLFVVLIMFVYAVWTNPQANILEWGGLIVGVISSYSYFNVQEAKTLKDLEFKKMDMNGGGSAVAADGTKPPVEG